MSKEERLLNFENELNFGIETNDGTLHVLKSDVIQAVSDLLDELDQPQLTIPKSIAEIADKYVDEFGFNLIEKDEALELTVAIDNPVDELESELIYDFADKNPELLAAYLAGKALGVDLVKVVEG